MSIKDFLWGAKQCLKNKQLKISWKFKCISFLLNSPSLITNVCNHRRVHWGIHKNTVNKNQILMKTFVLICLRGIFVNNHTCFIYTMHKSHNHKHTQHHHHIHTQQLKMCFHIWKYEFESALLANTAMNTHSTKTDFYIILLYYNDYLIFEDNPQL